jgi:hypothetical protein
MVSHCSLAGLSSKQQFDLERFWEAFEMIVLDFVLDPEMDFVVWISLPSPYFASGCQLPMLEVRVVVALSHSEDHIEGSDGVAVAAAVGAEFLVSDPSQRTSWLRLYEAQS